MAEAVILDCGPLGMLCHPRVNRAIVDWFRRLLLSGASVLLPEIADYEVRRELIRAKLTRSIERLDRLKGQLGYLPLS